MNVLLVNVGNTNTVVARGMAEDGRLTEPPQTLFSGPTPHSESEQTALSERLASCRRGSEPVGVASVVPAVNAAVERALPEARFVDHSWDFPFAVAVRGAETVGADRWCNVAAAAAAGLADALIVDAGTATTIDVLQAGRFVGGLIAPGMAFAAEQLQRAGARLWTVPFAPCELRPGRDTEEALRVGAYHVGVHGITGTVAALLATMPSARVVLTGGLGVHLARPGWLHDPDWTLRGLASLLLR